ncbi:cysteine proteinase [Coniochaeta ligniaria NRRL 30616]|uniref:Ubiquitin carboxyl-terminal hydrolase n=1 Tax=Coniochaeta ligniaria NRRL 30616 TaxID=1408157 RepID=A0A1J7JAY2_9PEZI|nr:cysteine proteinase [Coniochaeta ligniaria NRRL 30616]
MARASTNTRTSAAPSSRPGSRSGKPDTNLEDDAPPTVRRSGRARRPPAIQLGENSNSKDEIKSSPTFAKSVQKSTADEQRRNPKRKAAPEVFDLPDDLLDKALAPMEPNELDKWKAWVELESDPAFFNVILKDLGVKDVKMQELFSVDEGSLSILPKPVHGLIFLYQYLEEDAQEPTENGEKVWFANQTTDNACATLALFNIIMNAQDIELGDRLKAFKDSSSSLLPPLRGNLLCNTTWIRKVHNQFARRLDLLNADLVLAQEAKEATKRKARPAKRQKTKPSTDAAFHFIAYVPVGDEVYQLDGLEKAPACIGKVDADSDWTAIARPFIESRMLQYESEQLSFNLLALCRSPLHQLREELVASITELAQIDHATHKIDPSLGRSFPEGSISSRDDDLCFADFGLPDTLPIDLDAKHTLETQPLEAGGATLMQKLEARREELETEQARLKAEYRAEAAMVEDDARRANGRKKDYTPFIHRWVQRLAEQGALQQIAEEVAVQQG